MKTNIQTKEEACRMDMGWWAPAALLVMLTIAEWTGAFALVSKVSALATSLRWTPASSFDMVGK
jgi:hypothetical protein